MRSEFSHLIHSNNTHLILINDDIVLLFSLLFNSKKLTNNPNKFQRIFESMLRVLYYTRVRNLKATNNKTRMDLLFVCVSLVKMRNTNVRADHVRHEVGRAAATFHHAASVGTRTCLNLFAGTNCTCVLCACELVTIHQRTLPALLFVLTDDWAIVIILIYSKHRK